MKKYSAGEWNWKELKARLIIGAILTVILLLSGKMPWYYLAIFWLIMIPLARSIYNSRHNS